MKKLLLVAAIGVAGVMGAKSTNHLIKHELVKKVKFANCSVTIYTINAKGELDVNTYSADFSLTAVCDAWKASIRKSLQNAGYQQIPNPFVGN